jgi:hypothetical protein
MNDTHPEIEKVYSSMMMKKSGEERMLMGFSMYEAAREIVLSTISDKENWRVSYFERFYQNDFDEQTKIKIIKRLQDYSHSINPKK